jgi:aspartyl/asparaginyl beta-hydroxylase (cupin superfamily)
VLIPRSELAAPPDPERRYRLLEVVRRCGRERHYSERTIEAYVHWIRRYVLHFGRRHPRELGAADVSAFLTSLAAEGGSLRPRRIRRSRR